MRIRSLDDVGAAPWAPALLVGLTVLAYLPVLLGDFVFDDPTYVGLFPAAGLGEALQRIWLTTDLPDYYPVTRTLFWLEDRLWRGHPSGYHAVNLALHGANVLLLWGLLRRLRLPAPWLASLVFALHPVNVQAVAWISQRKTLLAAGFCLASLLSYLEFEDSGGRRRWYAASTTLFALALMSKSSAIVLPALLLLLLWWRRGRLAARELLALAPFLVLTVLFAVNALGFEARNPVSSEAAVSEVTWAERLAGAGTALGFYASKALWPEPLAFVYPRWQIAASSAAAFLPTAAALALGLGLGAAALRAGPGSGTRSLFVAFAWYAIALAPVLGFADFGHLLFSPVADQYQYLSLAAFGAGFAWATACAGRRWAGAPLLALGLVAIYGVLTWQQASLYRSREAIWLDTLEKDPASWLAHNNLGAHYYAQGRHPAAARHYAASLALRDDPRTRTNLGLAELARGDREAAMAQLAAALRSEPGLAAAHAGLGAALADANRLPEAVEAFREAARLQPDRSQWHADLGLALAVQGDFDAAARSFREALRLDPGNPQLRAQLDRALADGARRRDAGVPR